MDLGRIKAARLVADLAFLGFVGELSLVLGGLLESLSLPKALSEMVENPPVFAGDGGAWSLRLPPRWRPRLSGDCSCLFCCSSPRAWAYRCGSMAAAAAASKPTWNTPLCLLGGRLCCDMLKAGFVAIGAIRGAEGRPEPSELFRLWPPPMSERSTDDLDRWWWWRGTASASVSVVGGCEVEDAGRPCIVFRPVTEDMVAVVFFRRGMRVAVGCETTEAHPRLRCRCLGDAPFWNARRNANQCQYERNRNSNANAKL
jgi:hypothetical protein